MMRHLRRASFAGVVALVALLAFLPVANAAPQMAETKTVAMKDFKFDPKTLTVNVGDTVVWPNQDQAPHTATAEDNSFNSGTIEAGKSFSFTFTKAGTFPYYCTLHGGPGGAGMAGVITVQEAAAQPQPTTAPTTPAQPQPTTAPSAAAPTGSIDVADQPIADGMITVANATISQDGWIIVHKAGPDGKLLLTPPVGMALIKAGDNKDVMIKLTEPVAVGAPLWPMLHIDAGTVGTYEFPNGPDVPVVAGGMPVMKEIKITEAGASQPAPAAPAGTPTGTISVGNQAVVNNTITVSQVSISQDGWIIVHKAGPDGKILLTPPVGMAQIKAGDTRNVVITLTEPVAVGARLWPMVHIDAGTMGTYEFPNGPDVPVVAGGMPLMKEITIQAAGAPAQLPQTGERETNTGILVLSALLLLLAGAFVTQRASRRNG